jgi:thiamine-phosphate pyrophosphorylase
MEITRDLRRMLSLYVIPDRVIGAPLSLEEQTRLALEGGATAIQLRDKSMDGGELLAVARRMAGLCSENGALFIVNDRLDVALLSDADGVHLGQSDLPLTEARKLIDSTRPFLVGVSVHTAREARQAEADGADYLGLGAAFGTGSKDDAKVIGLHGLREVRVSTKLPCVAIGGITFENLPGVMGTGVDGAAVISAAVRGDVKSRVAALKVRLDSLTLCKDYDRQGN